jgi:phage gp16-like protein
MAARIIAAIHASRRQVPGLEDEEAWRLFLLRHADLSSLRSMDAKQLGRVLDALHGAGAPRRASRLDEAQHRMALGLWITLWKHGVVKNPTDGALDGFVRRVTRVGRLAWCSGDQANKVIEALKDWSRRSGITPAP